MLQSLHLYQYMLSKLQKQLVSSKRQRNVVTKTSPATSSSWQCLLLKSTLYIYSTLHLKQVNFLTLENCSNFTNFQRWSETKKSNWPIPCNWRRIFRKQYENFQILQHKIKLVFIGSYTPQGSETNWYYAFRLDFHFSSEMQNAGFCMRQANCDKGKEKSDTHDAVFLELCF